MPRSSSALLSSPKLSTLILCTLICSTLSFAAAPDRVTGPIVAQQLTKLSAGVPMRAQPQYDQGPVDPSFKLSYMTLLTVPSASQQKAIDQLLVQQQDPRSPLYHKWLTPEQYADRFGLSPNDVQKITNWLQSEGFSIHNVARGRNWIVFSGTAAQVENAFQTQIHNYDVNGEKHFSNTTRPSIPSALAGIVAGVGGLNNFRPKSYLHRRNPDYTLPVTGGDLFFLAPGDIATIYDITPLYNASTPIDGTGQKLAVVGRTDVYLADLNDFRSGFGLTTISCTPDANGLITTACNTTNFRYVLNGPDPGVNSLGDDLFEADIDLEWSGAVARNAQIIYVNSGGTARDVFDAYYYSIDNDLAPVITMSYGFCELDEASSGLLVSDEAELKKANTEGITFMNSSGDSGAASCDFQTNLPQGGYAVSYPASSPSITGVGGTLVPYTEYTPTYWSTTNDPAGGSALQYIPEEGWNDAQEIGEFCVANPTNTRCTNAGITSWATAQSAVGVLAGGGGLSNCVKETGGVCATPPNGGFPQPAWQAGLVIPGQTTAVRFSPDVSLLASVYWPGYIICTPVNEIQGGTNTASICANGIKSSLQTYGISVGGTSVSSPIFAGIVTLLNQSFVGPGSSGLGNINPKLYSLAATPANGAFHSAVASPPSLTFGSDGAFCPPGTPANQPLALQCPPSGFLGFDASNFDPTSGYNLVTGLGSVDVNKLAIAWAGSRTVTTITIQAQPTQVLPGQTVKLTATVTPSSATGQVSFFNNGSPTALGTATLSSGVATFSTTTLPVGTNNITASFAGDGYNQPSTTAVAAIVTVAVPDFTVTNTGTTSATVKAGVSGVGYGFTVAPLAPATTFGATVTFACSGLDATTSCIFNPASIPGTSGSTPVTLTITTSGPNTGAANVQPHQRADNRLPWLPFTLPIAGVVMVGLTGRKVSRYSAIVGLCLALGLISLLIACGSSTPISVTAVSPNSVSLWPNDTADGWPSSTQAFAATVSNNTAVTWSISPSGASSGSIDAASGVYTAPTVAAGLPPTVTVKATSQVDSSKSNTATITLKVATVPQTFNNVVVTVTDTTTPPTSHALPPLTLVVQ